MTDLLAVKVKKIIITGEEGATYFSIIVDSTPDTFYIDQLSFAIRYVDSSGTSLSTVLTNPGHKPKSLAVY